VASNVDLNQKKQSVEMAKLIFLGIGALLLITAVMTVIQYFVINLLKRREEDDKE
jgi:hypothetical protein